MNTRSIAYHFPNGFKTQHHSMYGWLRHANLHPEIVLSGGEILILLPTNEITCLWMMQRHQPSRWSNLSIHAATPDSADNLPTFEYRQETEKPEQARLVTSSHQGPWESTESAALAGWNFRSGLPTPKNLLPDKEGETPKFEYQTGQPDQLEKIRLQTTSHNGPWRETEDLAIYAWNHQQTKPGIPEIVLVAAMSTNGVIGADNQLPWQIPAEMKHFVATTRGSNVLMGHKTFKSIGKPLPGRTNIVLSRSNQPANPKITWATTETPIKDLPATDNRIFVIGGAEIYEQFIETADRVILSLIPQIVEGDTYFPLIPSRLKPKLTRDNPDFLVLDYLPRNI